MPVKPKYNILAVKTVGERDLYTRIGVGFPLEKGGFNILFDAHQRPRPAAPGAGAVRR